MRFLKNWWWLTFLGPPCSVDDVVTMNGLLAEISRVRRSVVSFSGDDDALDLPEPVGPVVTLSEKLNIPVKEHPEVLTERNQCHAQRASF